MEEVLLTVNDLSDILKVTPQYVRKLIRDNEIEATRIGNQWLVSEKELSNYIHENNFHIEPDDHERLSDDIPDIIALSFFSGAMGLDIGMKEAGIKSLLVSENNKYCRMTIDKNAPDLALIGDINNYSSSEILKMAKIPKDKIVDVIFGGPPCQAFSTAGARRGLEDERGNVFLKYIEVVKAIKPTYVVIENVRGLLSTPYQYGELDTPIKGGALLEILDRLEEAGYSISFELYNSANFGSPQIRERVVLIGKIGNKKVQYLKPEYSENGEFGLKPWRTLGDTLERYKISKHHHIEFPEKRLKFYRMLKEGQYWKHLPKEVQKEAMGEKLKLGGGKTGFFRRLSFGRPSPTLVTNPTMPATDLAHPIENRPLSVEEYAAIQEFPKDWNICGPILEQYKQIGNAVPIRLGKAIGETIIADMKGIQLPIFEGFKYSRYRNTNDVSWKKDMLEKLKKAEMNENGLDQLSMLNY